VLGGGGHSCIVRRKFEGGDIGIRSATNIYGTHN
jgi:hypothetical protein